MKVVIDLDNHEAIQDFGIRAPAGAYQFKSQDTVEWELYFAQGGVVQDMGAGFALKFGMVKTGDTTNTLLAYQTAFTYKTDANGNVYYSGLVNFNTAQMATAIGTAASLQGTAEVRFQDSLSEIIHSINISTVVYATILVETGVTPPNVSTGYPDASTIELLVHKNAVNGYAGLDAGGDLLGSVIPVDGQTIVVNSNGDIASAAILAITSANFITPASGGTVSVTCVSNSALKVGSYVRIPIAGYYIVETVSGDGVTATLQNNGDPFNALAGVTITSGAAILPAQAAAGGGGTPGANAFTTTLASFIVPAAGATVSVNLGATNWLGGSGYVVFIAGAGYYAVSSITDATHALLTNLGYAATNAAAGTNIASGAMVSPGGVGGAAGATGTSGANAYDTTTASFVMPAAAASVNVTINNTTWLATGQVVFIQGAGYFTVASIISPTIFSATNANYPGAAAPGSTIASAAKVSVAGLIGPQGAGGAGLNAFTTLSVSYTQPTAGNNVTITVGTTAWMAAGQGIFIVGGGYYTVSSVGDLTHVTVTNLGISGNAAPGATVTGSGTQTVSPAGTPGTNGVNAYTATTAPFTTPAAGSSVTVTVNSTAWAALGQILFITGAGYYQVAAILSGVQFSLTNLAGYGNLVGGTNISAGASVSPSGVIGPAGPIGPPGAAGRDGAFATIYTGNSIQGTGGVASPATLVGDVAQGTNAYAHYQRDVSGNSIWAPIPTDGTTITVSGGKLTVIGGTGGGGGLLTADVGIQVQSDFVEASIAGTGWNFAGNGVTPTLGSNVGCDATNKGAGVAVLPPGTTTNQRSVLTYGQGVADSNSANDHYVPALGVLDLRFRVWVPSLYSATANYSIMRIGMITDDGTGAIRNGLYFEYNYGLGASNNWNAITASAGTITRNPGTVALVAAQWMNLRIVTDAAWANVSFYMNGTLIHSTISAFTLPTSPMPLNVYNAWAAGTPVNLYVDYAEMKYTYSRGTW